MLLHESYCIQLIFTFTLSSLTALNENGDVTFFATVEAAARALEPVDVRNQEFVVYDSEGYVLQPLPIDPVVAIVDGKEDVPRAEELADVIRDFFSRAGVDQEWSMHASLSELVSEGMKLFESS